MLHQKFCRDRHVFVATRHVFCRDKIMQVSLLSRQKFCRHKHVSVATNICCDIFLVNKHDFVATKVLSRQAYFCRDKGRVLSRRDKHLFVATKMILAANHILWPPLLVGCNHCRHLWGMSYNSCWLLAATVEDCVGDQESRVTQQSFLLPDVLILLFGSTCSGCCHTW